MNVGKNIRALREKAEMTQVELAEKIGITQSMLCQIERGTKACSIPLGAEIAAVLGCEINDLLAENAERSLCADTRSA